VKTQCTSIFGAHMRTAVSLGSLPTHKLRLPRIITASGDVDRDGGGRAAGTVWRPRAGGRMAVDVVAMAADASGVGSGVGSL
jgi:hypothetical protein